MVCYPTEVKDAFCNLSHENQFLIKNRSEFRAFFYIFNLPLFHSSHPLFVSMLNFKPLCSLSPSDDQLGPIITTTAVVMVCVSPLVQSVILSKQSLIALIHIYLVNKLKQSLSAIRSQTRRICG